ncbi:hypothetical protein GWK47_009123 [Chionoecetes opilio]|uniref:Uncharacterized protein n=1 Tax=Chionoecetes opilio TaxID=41210 RepID=A0A8J4XYX1_CHIOP|nr:hypothetical protein GWK47_009123 [Chionoecetes opilio]
MTSRGCFSVTGVKDDVPLRERWPPLLKYWRRASGSQSFRSAQPSLGYAFPQEPVLLVPCSLFPHLMKVHNMPHLVLGCRGRGCVMAAHTSSSSSSSDRFWPTDRIG